MTKAARIVVLCFIIAAASIGCQPTRPSPDVALSTPALMRVPEMPTSRANPTPSASPTTSTSPEPSTSPTPSASPRPSVSPVSSASPKPLVSSKTSTSTATPASTRSATHPKLNRDESPVPDKFTLVRYPTKNGSLLSLLSAEARKAQEAGRRPYLEVYAEWCGPCKALRSSLSDRRMVDAFIGTYIIQVDWDAWDAQLSEAGFTVEAVPAFFALSADGKPTRRTITGAAWGEDIPENMAPPLKKFFTQE